MKKLFALILVLALALCLTACGKKDETPALTTVKVGASVTPHAEILRFVTEAMAEKGYALEVVEYTDYIIPNTAVEDGDLLANFFQHITYMNDFNVQNGTHLVSVASVHYEPLGLYAGKTASLADLPDGAVIAVPNDGTNEARALKLLEAAGLITLREGVGYTATVLDIVDNPHGYDIREIEAAQIPRSLQDVDLGVINGNYALEAGLSIADALAQEASDSGSAIDFANVIAVKEGSEQDPAIVALLEVLLTDEIRAYIEQTYSGAVVPLF